MNNEKDTDKLKDKVAKYKIKDSVFTHLFQDKKYLFQLYKALHPEDNDATEDELTDITLHNILTDDSYNDLGFLVGSKLLILMEAQSTWSVNIVIRILMYLMATYQDYIDKTKQNVYRSKRVKLPKPELYLIYTGDRKAQPEYISLSEEFFEGQKDFLDANVKVLYGSTWETKNNDIVTQYVTFTKVYNEQMNHYGRTREAVIETIRICKDKNILREYLSSREKEVVSIMLAMYDEKEVLRSYIESEVYENSKSVVIQMLKVGKMSIEEIAQCFPNLTIDDVKRIQDELLQTV